MTTGNTTRPPERLLTDQERVEKGEWTLVSYDVGIPSPLMGVPVRYEPGSMIISGFILTPGELTELAQRAAHQERDKYLRKYGQAAPVEAAAVANAISVTIRSFSSPTFGQIAVESARREVRKAAEKGDVVENPNSKRRGTKPGTKGRRKAGPAGTPKQAPAAEPMQKHMNNPYPSDDTDLPGI